jgi:PKD repeat protein
MTSEAAARRWSRPLLVGGLAALVLVALVAAVPLGLAPTPKSAPGPAAVVPTMAEPAASCPSPPNVTADSVTIITTGNVGPAPFTTTLCGYSGSPYAKLVWSFGDGTASSSGTNLSSVENYATHTFSTSGAYLVWCNVTYGGNISALSSAWVYATGATPHGLTFNVTVSPTSGAAPLQVRVYPNITGCRGQCDWNVTASVRGANLTTPGSPGFPWVPVDLSASGTWKIVVNATDPLGDSGVSLPAYVTVGGTGNNSTSSLTARIFDYPSGGAAPLDVFFNVSASGGVAPYTFAWTFGDGGNGSGEVISHVYPSAGTYVVNVTVWDSSGLKTTASTSVRVSPPGSNSTSPLVTYLNATVLRGHVPFNTTLTVGARGGTPPYLLYLCPGDGGCLAPLSGWNGARLNFTFGFTVPGNYTATATVNDSNGSSVLATLPIVAEASSPLLVQVLNSPLTGPAPLAVGFLASVTGGTPPYTIQWAWGDGTVGSSANGGIVAHDYAAAGLYHPTLTVSDAANASVILPLETVNATSGLSQNLHPGSGLPPTGPGWMTLAGYLGVAAAAAVLSAVGMALWLRRRRRASEANGLARALETQATRAPEPPTESTAEGQR